MFKCCWNFGRTEFSFRRQCTVGCYNLPADCGVLAWSKVDWRRAPFRPPGRCVHGRKCSACQWHDYNWSATNCQICSCVSKVIIRYNPSCYYQCAGFQLRCVLDGCRECWRRIKSKSIWPLHVTISACKTQIQHSFSADMSPWSYRVICWLWAYSIWQTENGFGFIRFLIPFAKPKPVQIEPSNCFDGLLHETKMVESSNEYM